MFKTIFIAVAAIATLAQPAFAQQVIGRSVVDGRSIVILDNGKWSYEDATPDSECDRVGLALTFCGVGGGWSPSVPANADIAAAYRYDDRHYGQMIVEALGVDDGMTLEFMKRIVVENAALITGANANDIPVLDIYEGEVDGRPIETIVYALQVEGLDVVYANGILTSPQQTMQLMTFAIGKDFTARHRALHEDFLANIRFE